MTAFQIFALLVLPLLILVIGVGAAWLHIRDLNRRHRLHPGE
jgi:hypothetical protein